MFSIFPVHLLSCCFSSLHTMEFQVDTEGGRDLSILGLYSCREHRVIARLQERVTLLSKIRVKQNEWKR